MIAEQALHNFWSGFGLTAYDENSVPDEAEMPYITYNVVTDCFDSEVIMSGSLWYRTISWAAITQKTDEISRYLGLGGIMLTFDDGGIWIKKSSPFAQRMGDESDDKIKRMVINISSEFISE